MFFLFYITGIVMNSAGNTLSNKANSSLHSEKKSNLEGYTNKLIADAIQLRNRYFDEKLNTKNLKIGADISQKDKKYYDIKNIINTVFTKNETIQESIKLTSTPEAKEFVKKYQQDLLKMFTSLLEVVHHPSRNVAAGHDSVHAAYDSYEILNYIKGIQSPVEEVATYFGSLLHDLGRTDEIEFKGGQQLDDSHALYSLIYLFQELKNFKKKFYNEHNDIGEDEKKELEILSKAFFKRIINSIIVHPGFNDTRDPVFHNVQSLDRLAGIYGQRFFVRILLADGLHHNAPIYPDLTRDYSAKLPNVFTTPDSDNYNLFHKAEQYTRGSFHKPVSLSLEHGENQVNEQTRQSLAILMLLSGGYDTDLFRQTFHPELVNGSREEFNNKNSGKKGVLPDQFKKLIQEKNLINTQEQETMETMKILDTFTLEKLFRIILKQQAMYLSDKDLNHFFVYLKSPKNEILKTPAYEHNLMHTLKYIIVRRELDRKQEIQTIEENLHNDNEFKKTIAEKSMKHPLWNVSLEEILKDFM